MVKAKSLWPKQSTAKERLKTEQGGKRIQSAQLVRKMQVSGYVRQTQQYLLKYIKNEPLITIQLLELQFKYEP